MKLQISKLLLTAVLLSGGIPQSHAGVQTDPVLTGAIAEQCNILKQIFKKRDKTQKAIIAAEGTVALEMKRMHDLEDKILNYMANVQGAFNNLYQMKRCGELVAIDIPKNMSRLSKAVSIGGVEGTMVGTLVGKELARTTTEMMSLYAFLKPLVTSGSYEADVYEEGHYNPGQIEVGEDGVPHVVDSWTDGKWTKKQKKVNLLDSNERYWILQTIQGKLENINMDLYFLSWEIETMRFRDIFFALDPDGWIKMMTGKMIVKSIIDDWNYNLGKWN